MGLLNWIFGNIIETLEIKDVYFGQLRGTTRKDDTVSWEAEVNIDDANVIFYFKGTREGISTKNKEESKYLISNIHQYIETSIHEIEKMHNESNLEFKADDFYLVCVSIYENGFELTFEQDESFHHFNCLFTNRVFDGISIDT